MNAKVLKFVQTVDWYTNHKFWLSQNWCAAWFMIVSYKITTIGFYSKNYRLVFELSASIRKIVGFYLKNDRLVFELSASIRKIIGLYLNYRLLFEKLSACIRKIIGFYSNNKMFMSFYYLWRIFKILWGISICSF